MTDWIKHRPPTEADADREGDVAVQRCPGSERSAYLHWSYVGPGVPWKRTSWWKPEPSPCWPNSRCAPQPPANPDFKPGQVWRSRNGMLCEIINIDVDPTTEYPIFSNLYGGYWHYPNGRSCLSGSDGPDHDTDLVELIKENSLDPEPEPKPLNPEAITAIPRRFVYVSRNVQANGAHTLDAIDDDGVAWWMVHGDPGWQQLPALPPHEVPANA